MMGTVEKDSKRHPKDHQSHIFYMENRGNLERLWHSLSSGGGSIELIEVAPLSWASHVIVHHRKESKSHELDLRDSW